MYTSRKAYYSAPPTTYFLRCAVVLVMMVAAATFLHINNYRPKQTFLSCDRPCHHLDWPMICRVKLTLEVFQSMSKSCGDCPANETACMTKHCVSADGQARGILTANRQLPGPSIQVCENDILVVDVINRLPGKAVAVHWRGQTQQETPFMDGAPLVTQCPIPSYTTFQYKFRASAAGTHLWHAHAGADVTNGLFGSLIVRQADLREPHRALYDVDDPNHVIHVSHWQHLVASEITWTEGHATAAALLINGKGRREDGPEMPLTTLTVVPGRRHRFRVANAGGAGSCPITLSVDGHSLLLIALDGQPIDPRHVTSITLAKGERADFVLKASNRISAYWLTVETVKGCGKTTVNGAAIIRYKGSPVAIPHPTETERPEIEETPENAVAMTTNLLEKCGQVGNLCITDIRGIRKMPNHLSQPKMDVTLYLPINYGVFSSDFAETRVPNVGNWTFTYPPSPLLTQGSDIAEEMMCPKEESEEERQSEGKESTSSPGGSRKCQSGRGDVVATCECVHVHRVPLGATVEIVLLDQGGLDDLVYHLHGYSFHIVAARKFGRAVSLRDIKNLDERGTLFSRNLESAPLKDTVVVPKHGAVALRFKADNPGYWILRDEHAADWTRGLDVILQVGEPLDMIAAPQDFPKCGSFVGPDYFLI